MEGSPPTSEVGALSGASIGAWSSFVEQTEHAPGLAWPRNLDVYREMKADGQVEALYRGTTLPIRRYKWMIDPNGASDQVVKELAEDLNLPIKGEEPRPGRRKKRFSFSAHLKWVLESVLWGHYYFEQVGEIVDGKWRLRKLAPRPPRIIEDIETTPHGGLVNIKVPGKTAGGLIPIPVDRLVAYVWDMEPGQWTGNSMLRSIYKNWLLKDRLIRIDLIKHDRAGSGIPTATAPPGASKPQIDALDRMARSMRVDEEGGGAVPHGTDFKLMGISGTVPDTWESIRGHNEEMARAWMSQVIQLGQTQTGSRSLGEVHLAALMESQETIAGWFADTFNEHVIEDWVDWNYGEDEAAPLVTYERPEEGALAVQDLAIMVDKNMIEVDEEMETWLRQNYRLPDKGEPRVPQQTSPPVTAAESRRGSLVGAEEESPSPLLPASRELRRRPYKHEIQAAVDFAELERVFVSMSGELSASLVEAQTSQVNELLDQIRKSGNDLSKLGAIEASPTAVSDIEDVMKRAVAAGETGAKSEAVAQGVRNPKGARINQAVLAERANIMADQIADGLTQVTRREAVRRAGPSITPQELATSVQGFLEDLSTAAIDRYSRGAVTRGINLGRMEFMKENEPSQIYASEILDENTCEECRAIDGFEFSSIAAMEADYPTGYINCLGGDNCRGTPVAVYDETEPSLP